MSKPEPPPVVITVTICGRNPYRYRAEVVEAGETIYTCERSTREGAAWNAGTFLAYRDPARPTTEAGA